MPRLTARKGCENDAGEYIVVISANSTYDSHFDATRADLEALRDQIDALFPRTTAQEAIAEVVAEEREQCALLVSGYKMIAAPEVVAARIRARSIPKTEEATK
jgi:hypothetical protein